MTKIRFVIGIDPGVHTAIAVYDRELKKIISTNTVDFWKCYEALRTWVKEDKLIVIEAPVKYAMYARQEEAQAEHAGGKRYGNKMMAAAAGNAREAELLADGLEILGFEVKRVRPTRRNFKKAEDDVAHVKRITGYEGRTNPHTRDSIMLCWGM